MLSHTRIEPVFALRRDTCSFFNRLPQDVVSKINNFYIADALHYAAYARKADVDALMDLLDKNPQLLLTAGNVITPAGDDVRNVTPYEFALGAGDPDLAQQIGTYFARIPSGEEERLRQYEPYRPHIEGMLTQQPYDLTPLIELIKQSPAADVTALLNENLTHESPLRDALIKFRKDHAPRVLMTPCMHYNHQSLKHAFEIFDREWGNLFQVSNGNYDKIDLVWWKFVCFEMRRLPGIDRCVLRQGIYYVVKLNQPISREDKFRDRVTDFAPILPSDDSPVSGLGIDCSVGSMGVMHAADEREHSRHTCTWAGLAAELLQTYVEQKHQASSAHAATFATKIGHLSNFLR